MNRSLHFFTSLLYDIETSCKINTEVSKIYFRLVWWNFACTCQFGRSPLLFFYFCLNSSCRSFPIYFIDSGWTSAEIASQASNHSSAHSSKRELLSQKKTDSRKLRTFLWPSVFRKEQVAFVCDSELALFFSEILTTAEINFLFSEVSRCPPGWSCSWGWL